MKKNMFEDVFIFLQFILVFTLSVLLIISFFIKEFMFIVNVLLALLLFVIAINNHIRYKRKYMTGIYFIMGLVVIGLLFI